jgi:hypothetical protein
MLTDEIFLSGITRFRESVRIYGGNSKYNAQLLDEVALMLESCKNALEIWKNLHIPDPYTKSNMDNFINVIEGNIKILHNMEAKLNGL